MAAPNTLIINSKTVIDANANFFANTVSANVSVRVGNTTVYTLVTPNAISTATLTVDNIISNGSITEGSANVVGTVQAGNFTTTGSLVAGVTVINANLTLGSISMTNGQVKVGQSYVQDSQISTPLAVVTTLGANTLTVNTATAVALTSNTFTLTGGATVSQNASVDFKAGANVAVRMVVDNTGLFYVNTFSANGAFKNTIMRTSVGAGNTDPNLTIGLPTIISTSLVANGTFTSIGNAGVQGTLTVLGTTNLVGSTSIPGGLNTTGFVSNTDSRVTRAAVGGTGATQGILYFGNGDKAVYWDAANWNMRGGTLIVSNLSSEGTVSMAGGLGVSGISNMVGAVAMNHGLTITDGQLRIYGWGGNNSVGTMWFSAGQNYIQFDGAQFQFSNDIKSVGSVVAPSVYAAGGALFTHKNNNAGTIYFGNLNTAYFDYNGAGVFTCNQNITFAGYVNSSATMYAAAGFSTPAGITAGSVAATTIRANGGSIGADASIYIGSTNAVNMYQDGTNGIIDCASQRMYMQYISAYGFDARSDERLKDITPFMSDHDALNSLVKIDPIQFSWNEDSKIKSNGNNYGFRAQQVQKVYPDLVTEDREGWLTVAYNGFIPVLAASVRELKTDIDALKAEIAALKSA
jgi:hypothetical protein